ncbi:hypothetical protein AB6A40_002870 [Gnathostoma spinigerum]|uniref:Secreted protein n=1 Tax=Gnathostoma spinigerum TaxID=75299 RepID=A0ABD6E963_9BILA
MWPTCSVLVITILMSTSLIREADLHSSKRCPPPRFWCRIEDELCCCHIVITHFIAVCGKTPRFLGKENVTSPSSVEEPQTSRSQQVSTSAPLEDLRIMRK